MNRLRTKLLKRGLPLYYAHSLKVTEMGALEGLRPSKSLLGIILDLLDIHFIFFEDQPDEADQISSTTATKTQSRMERYHTNSLPILDLLSIF